jgi:hypothetical protein
MLRCLKMLKVFASLLESDMAAAVTVPVIFVTEVLILQNCYN